MQHFERKNQEIQNVKHTNDALIESMIPEIFKNALMDQPSDLSQDLKKIIYLTRLENDVIEVKTNREDGFSTYELNVIFEGTRTPIGTIQFAPIFTGEYLIRKTLLFTKTVISVTEQYDKHGKYIGKYFDNDLNLLWVNMTDMEPRCPVLSHLYNVLLWEYQQAEGGTANSTRILTIEKLFRSIDEHSQKHSEFTLGYKSKPMDEGMQVINKKLRENEIDAALNYKEKKALRSNLLKERKSIIQVKSRVHKMPKTLLAPLLTQEDWATKWHGFKMNPAEKLKGLLYQYTVGIVLWFFSVVRSNIGYSVALGIYAPFTYYFITQPMNPGAVWAVGKVRSAWLATVGAAQSTGLLSLMGEEDTQTIAKKPDSQNTVYDPSTPYSHLKPKFEDFLISIDVPKVEKQSWKDRMANFKDMQIAYESNLRFSERMGRLEQMENQLNFPLIAEAAYREMEAYAERIVSIQETIEIQKLNKPEISAYLTAETKRIKQYKLYIWDKVVRYMLDHPYLVMNEAKDQLYVDYYIGRNFIFLEEITQDLQKEYQGLKKPKGYKTVEELSKFYQEKKIEGKTVEERLQKNSWLAKQNGFYSSDEMRAYMKRQWEILYLSYNRAEEPSNFGLQMYIWSVRNAIWGLSSLVTSKNRELTMIQDVLSKPNDTEKTKKLLAAERIRIEPMYESLYHILSMEYVSLREELNGKLRDDIDSTQRQAIIDSIHKSFEERTLFLNALGLN